MVLLGAYHQVKLHKNMVLMAGIGKNGGTERISNNSYLSNNAVSKFNKTIKIESLIGIGVLFTASLLTITSPPPHIHQQPGTMSEMGGLRNNGSSNYFQETMISGISIPCSQYPFSHWLQYVYYHSARYDKSSTTTTAVSQ